MEKALVSMAVNTEDKVAESIVSASPQNSAVLQISAAQVPTALKGVSQSLLNRVGTLGAQRGDLTAYGDIGMCESASTPLKIYINLC